MDDKTAAAIVSALIVTFGFALTVAILSWVFLG